MLCLGFTTSHKPISLFWNIMPNDQLAHLDRVRQNAEQTSELAMNLELHTAIDRVRYAKYLVRPEFLD
jgi:hypothetical protein